MSRKGKPKRLKVAIGTPTGGTPTMEYAQSLFVASKHKNVVDLLVNQSCRVAHNRNNIVRAFLAGDGDALLFVDDDMMWRDDALDKMLEHFDVDTAPVIGGLTFGYDSGTVFTTLHREAQDEGRYVRLAGFPHDDKIEVDATGGACLLIARHVLEKVAEGRDGFPWFQETIVNGHETGEDITFCRRVKEAGFPIFVATGAHFTHIKGPLGLNLDSYVSHLRKDRFVFAGDTAGNEYIAQVLTAMHVPTGLDVVFSDEGVDWSAYRGVVSKKAFQHLDDFDGMVFHVVEHPLRAVPRIADELGITFPDAAKFLYVMNSHIEPYAHYRINVEGADYDTFRMVTHEVRTPRSQARINGALTSVPVPDYGMSRTAQWSQLGEWGDHLKDQAELYGYAV